MKRLKGRAILKTDKEFGDAYQHARKWHTDCAVCHFKADPAVRKVAFVASKKIGGAVARNRAKRRLRAEFIRHADQLKDGIYLFVAKAAINQADVKKLSDDFTFALTKLSSRK